jgi:exonuclease V
MPITSGLSANAPLDGTQEDILLAQLPHPTPASRPSTPSLLEYPKTSAHPLDSSRKYALHLVDTKTRRTSTLPPDEDTLSARLQLMLYYHLLSALLSPTFSFSAFWVKVGVNPNVTLSQRFRLQTGLILGNGGARGEISRLHDLVRIWQEKVALLDVQHVERKMTLVYRTQPTKAQKQRRRSSLPVGTIAEQRDLEQAIRASLADVGVNADDTLVGGLVAGVVGETSEVGASNMQELLVTPHRADGEVPTPLREDPELLWAIQQSLQDARPAELPKDSGEAPKADGLAYNRSTAGKGASSAQVTEESSDEEVDKDSFHIIGTKELVVDELELNEYIAGAFEWWHGRRQARGVPLELSRRCLCVFFLCVLRVTSDNKNSTCEYCEGCEWREQKAEEATKKAQAKRAESHLPTW